MVKWREAGMAIAGCAAASRVGGQWQAGTRCDAGTRIVGTPGAAFQVSRRKDWRKVEAPHPNHVWQSDMTKVWAGPSRSYLVSVIDCCTREIVGWDLSLRCPGAPNLAAPCWRLCLSASSGTGFDFDDRQRHAVYVRTICRNPESAGHHAPGARRPIPRATGSSQLERRGGVGPSVRELRPGRAEHRSLDRGVRCTADSGQNAARIPCSVLCPNPFFKHGPMCPIMRGALHE